MTLTVLLVAASLLEIAPSARSHLPSHPPSHLYSCWHARARLGPGSGAVVCLVVTPRRGRRGDRILRSLLSPPPRRDGLPRQQRAVRRHTGRGPADGSCSAAARGKRPAQPRGDRPRRLHTGAVPVKTTIGDHGRKDLKRGEGHKSPSLASAGGAGLLTPAPETKERKDDDDYPSVATRREERKGRIHGAFRSPSMTIYGGPVLR